MMHHPHPFLTIARSTVFASGLCLGLLFACGGSTEGNPDDTTGPTDGGPTDGGPTDGGPTDGGPTDGGPTTSGGPTTDGGNGGSGGGTNNCPSVEPAEGSSCAEDSQTCAYENCVAPDYRNGHELVCVNGAWSLLDERPCDDVPIECPPNVYLGAYCGVPEGTGPCTVYDACGSFRQVYCTNGYWQYSGGGSEDAAPSPDGFGGASAVGTPSATATTGVIPVPQCPDYPPTQGSPCCPSSYPEYCDYSASGSDSAVGMAATGGAFTAVTTGSGGAGTGGDPAPPILTCAVCGPNLYWEESNVCP